MVANGFDQDCRFETVGFGKHSLRYFGPVLWSTVV
jgi:hypothetical protein